MVNEGPTSVSESITAPRWRRLAVLPQGRTVSVLKNKQKEKKEICQHEFVFIEPFRSQTSGRCGWWKRSSRWWNEEKGKRRTHRGTRRRLLRLVTEAAGGFGGAGRGPRGTHQMEHMVLVLLQEPKRVVVTPCHGVGSEIWRTKIKRGQPFWAHLSRWSDPGAVSQNTPAFGLWSSE